MEEMKGEGDPERRSGDAERKRWTSESTEL